MRSSAHDLCTFCKCSDSTSMLIFGLTGGIATGKSTVSDILLELGCPVIDADVLARRGRLSMRVTSLLSRVDMQILSNTIFSNLKSLFSTL